VRNLVRRVNRLEQQHFDATGLVPRSEAWYEFYWDKMERLLAGEDIGMRIPLEAFDEMMRRVSLQTRSEKPPIPKVTRPPSWPDGERSIFGSGGKHRPSKERLAARGRQSGFSRRRNHRPCGREGR